MNLTKFNPVDPTDSIGKWIDTLFNTTLTDVIGSDNTISSPSVNVIEHDLHYEIDLAAPGLTKQDFNIAIEQDHLVISAERQTENEEKNGRFTRREFSYGSFKRSFQLDDLINREKITATYEDGVLKVTLPKKEEAAKRSLNKTIEIQ
ncbi:MAG TPA: Hsp20/alpha crystallin family protein [Saprospiraceae bacterium]|nr:Hsp20/alpha crystallin family protein [Saprospiraceae bacterium]